MSTPNAQPQRSELSRSTIFVNTYWMCDLFRSRKSARTYAEAVKGLVKNIEMSAITLDFLIRLAGMVDECERWLPTHPEVQDAIGLGVNEPQHGSMGYPELTGEYAKLFLPFVAAMVLDRCLWALNVTGSAPPDAQLLHPSSQELVGLGVPKDDSKDLLTSIIISLGALQQSGSTHVQALDPLVAANTGTVVSSAHYRSKAELNLAYSNIYILVSTLLSLSVGHNKNHLGAIIKAIESNPNRGPTLQAQLGKMYGKFGFRDQRPTYHAILISILGLFSPKFQQPRSQCFQTSQRQLMIMSGKSKGSMFYVSERSERRLWQQVLLILDGKDAQTTSASDLIPRGDGLQVALGGSSAEEQLLAMVSDFGAMKDSSSRIILRKTWPTPQQLPYAISGIPPADIPVPVATVFKRKVQRTFYSDKMKNKRPRSPSTPDSRSVRQKTSHRSTPHPGTIARYNTAASVQEVQLRETPFEQDLPPESEESDSDESMASSASETDSDRGKVLETEVQTVLQQLSAAKRPANQKSSSSRWKQTWPVRTGIDEAMGGIESTSQVPPDLEDEDDGLGDYQDNFEIDADFVEDDVLEGAELNTGNAGGSGGENDDDSPLSDDTKNQNGLEGAGGLEGKGNDSPPPPAQKRDGKERIPDQGDQVEGGNGQDDGEDEMPEDESQEEPDDEDGTRKSRRKKKFVERYTGAGNEDQAKPPNSPTKKPGGKPRSKRSGKDLAEGGAKSKSKRKGPKEKKDDTVWSTAFLRSMNTVEQLHTALPADLFKREELDPVNTSLKKRKLHLNTKPGQSFMKESISVLVHTGDPDKPFERRSYTINWPSASEPRTLLDSLLKISGHTNSSVPYQSPKCLSVLDTTVASWSDEHLKKMFKDHDIHIIPSRTPENRGFNRETCERLGINVFQPRDAHENQSRKEDDSHAHMRCGSIHSLLESNPNEVGRQDVNFLSISLPYGFHPPSDCNRRLSLIPQASQHFTHTDMPASSTHWAVVATPPSMSMPHIDAGKFCTEVETIRGAKLWFIRDTDVTPTVNALSAMDPTDHQWVGLVLPADHRLLMRPGTEHMVYTLEDTVMDGRHFYTADTLQLSLKAGLREHCWGRYSTNTEHLKSEAILHGLLMMYRHQLDQKSNDNSVQLNLPSNKDLAALIAMCTIPEAFEPQPLLENNQPDPWELPATIYADRWNSKQNATVIMGYMPGLLPIVRAFMDVIDKYLKDAAENPVDDAESEEEEYEDTGLTPMAVERLRLRRNYVKNHLHEDPNLEMVFEE